MITDVFVYKGGNQEVPKDVTHVHIHPLVREIASKAFQGCQKLREVVFSNDGNLAVIGRFAFYGCVSLDLILLPNTTKRILCGAFINCSSAKWLVLNPGLEEIGLSSFRGCHGLQYVAIPSTVRLMEARVFVDCTGLLEVAIENGLTKIPESTFENCDALKVIGLPPSVTSIGVRAIPRETWQVHEYWISVRDRVKSYIKMKHHSDCRIRQNDYIPDRKEAPLPISPAQLSQDSSLWDFAQEDSHDRWDDSELLTRRPLGGNLVVSRQKWEEMSNRLKAAEEHVNCMKSQLNTITAVQDNKASTACQKFNELDQNLHVRLTRLGKEQASLQSDLEITKTSLVHQTTIERNELKEEIAAMKQCLKTLKRGFDLLVHKDQTKFGECQEIENDPSEQGEETKKRPRHDDCEETPGNCVGVIQSIKRRVLTWSQRNEE
ncbi:MAG: hypothetical protein SGBAC_007199 [Bacillariaceae sp.]